MIEFLDSNVIVYANDHRETAKRQVAQAVLRRVLTSGQGVISTQVLSEYAAVALTKLRLDSLRVLRQIQSLQSLTIVPVTPALVERAIELQELLVLNYWDAQLIAAAEQARCDVLLSEDLNAGQNYAGVRVQNPFA